MTEPAAERDRTIRLVVVAGARPNFMKIAPLTVNERCSVWRAADYLVDVGLRHLPVVDDGNEVVGMLTRGDLCGQSARGDGE